MSDSVAGLRVGRLPYLNAWPFRNGWRGPEPRWLEATPRQLGVLAAADAIDAACLASRDALALADRYRPLADLGIATRGAVASVLLLSSRPLGKLGGRRIALSNESRTSRGLLRVLLAGPLLGTLGENAVLCEDSFNADAQLTIGDAALSEHDRWPHAVDLGEAWTKWTDLPFVWARWVVRRDIPAARARRLALELGRSLDAPWQPARAPRPPGIGPADATRYLERFRYRLGPAEEAGLRRFHQELEQHDLLDHYS